MIKLILALLLISSTAFASNHGKLRGEINLFQVYNFFNKHHDKLNLLIRNNSCDVTLLSYHPWHGFSLAVENSGEELDSRFDSAPAKYYTTIFDGKPAVRIVLTNEWGQELSFVLGNISKGDLKELVLANKDPKTKQIIQKIHCY